MHIRWEKIEVSRLYRIVFENKLYRFYESQVVLKPMSPFTRIGRKTIIWEKSFAPYSMGLSPSFKDFRKKDYAPKEISRVSKGKWKKINALKLNGCMDSYWMNRTLSMQNTYFFLTFAGFVLTWIIHKIPTLTGISLLQLLFRRFCSSPYRWICPARPKWLQLRVSLRIYMASLQHLVQDSGKAHTESRIDNFVFLEPSSIFVWCMLRRVS